MVRSFQAASALLAFLPFLSIRSRTCSKIRLQSDCDFLGSRRPQHARSRCQGGNTRSNLTLLEMPSNRNRHKAPCLVGSEPYTVHMESTFRFQPLEGSC